MAVSPMPFLLSLGSNLEPRAERIRRAITLLAEHLGPLVVSHLYETSPVGYSDQPDFLNCCVCGQTTVNAHALHTVCRSVEEEVGRERRERWREREIDVDVILLDDLVIDDPSVTIPHPRMQDRRFVLAPAAEIAPTMRDPRTGKTIAELLDACTDAGTVVMLPA